MQKTCLRMRAIIPVAGNGLRLRPVTNRRPKALIEVAGKPVLNYILENLARSHVEELVLIVGYMKEDLIEWVDTHFANRFSLHYVNQDRQLGLGHAIYCAKDFLDENELLITLGDEIFSREYSAMIEELDSTREIGAAIGVKRVDTPSQYGMIQIDPNGFVSRMVEKPKKFKGDLAIAGVYHFKDGRGLKSALKTVISRDSEGKEYQLTDALQLLVDGGERITTFTVGKWFDCGRLDVLLDSNRRLIEGSSFASSSSDLLDSEVVGPCIIAPNTNSRNSRIGPYVSVGPGAVIENCRLEDSIVESNAHVKDLDTNHVVIAIGGILSRE